MALGASMAGVIAVASITVFGVAPSFSATGGRYAIRIGPEPNAILAGTWSAEAELHSGNGAVVYRWHETSKLDTSYVRWEYTDGGDGGWIDLHVNTNGPKPDDFLKLPLGVNYCFHETKELRAVKMPDCTFD
jgi:hypothetical protein